jgi:hypothetical protein
MRKLKTDLKQGLPAIGGTEPLTYDVIKLKKHT